MNSRHVWKKIQFLIEIASNETNLSKILHFTIWYLFFNFLKFVVRLKSIVVHRKSSIFNFGFMMKFYDIKKFLSFNDFMTLILSSLWNIGIYKFEEKIFEKCPRITRKVWQKLFDLRMPIIMQHLACLIAWIRVYHLKYILDDLKK